MRRRHVLLLGLAGLAGAARAATAAAWDADAFAAAQAANRPILVDIWASWCPICAKQQPILDKLAADPAFSALTIFRVDFDAQKDVVRRFGARMQSTMVVFHGTTETGRAVGETNPDAIRALLATANA